MLVDLNALGISYLVLAGFAGVLACVHLAQGIVIRSDRTQFVLAALCLGFGLFDLAIAFSSAHTRAGASTWVGWHVMAAGSAAVLTVVVPMVAWQLFEVKLNRARQLVLGVAVVAGTARLISLCTLLGDSEQLTWEVFHSLEHPWVAATSILCPIIGGGSWAVEGALAGRRGVRSGWPMAVFGSVALVASVHGAGVTLGFIPPPDLFGLLTLPALSFVQVLSSVRFVQALQTANQPGGDLERYELLGKLGAGGMGEIFRARRRGPAGFLREVVVKTLVAGDEGSKDRFLVEARLAAQLRHPNIVDVYDLGEHPGGFFIVMELISGVTLDAVLARSIERAQPIPVDVVAELGAQMCRALSFAHAAGVIHRDTKQQNVMVSYAGVLKLIDFGIAQEVIAPIEPRTQATNAAPSAGLTQEGGVVGTPGYISPERLLGDPATVSSDLFAVGVVLYELLAQHRPFKARNPEAFVTAASERSFVRLSTLRSDASTALIDAIERCLEPTPNGRPASAASLQALLEASLEGRRVDLVAWLEGLVGGGPIRAAAALSVPTQLTPGSELPTRPQRRAR